MTINYKRQTDEMVDHVEGIDLSIVTNRRHADIDRLYYSKIVKDSSSPIVPSSLPAIAR